VLLEIFYPDSRGVNVFVGGAKTPDMALKLVRDTQIWMCLKIGYMQDGAPKISKFVYKWLNNGLW
jgi:hypothetical protein